MSGGANGAGVAARAVDHVVDGVERGILKTPAPIIGMAVGLLLGWVVNIVATGGPVEFMSPIEAEAMIYNAGNIVPLEAAPTSQHAASGTPLAAAAAGN